DHTIIRIMRTDDVSSCWRMLEKQEEHDNKAQRRCLFRFKCENERSVRCLIQDRQWTGYVAERHNAIVGFVFRTGADPAFFIHGLVEPSARGPQNIGKKLLQAGMLNYYWYRR